MQKKRSEHKKKKRKAKTEEERKKKGESFHFTKVNLVLNTHALQIILFGPVYV